MRRNTLGSVSLMLIMLATAMLISACSPATTPEAEPHQNEVEEPIAEELVEVVLNPDPVEQEANYCLDCHTDKQRLIDTARPEVVEKAESSGEG
jgi:hypothetical protein